MADTTKKKPTTIPPPAPVPAPRQNDLPTRKDVELIEAWQTVAERTGRTPTTRAVAEVLGVTQSAAQFRINQAAAKGGLVRDLVQQPGPYRISKEGKRWLTTIAK